jgi:hypothetical protein
MHHFQLNRRVRASSARLSMAAGPGLLIFWGRLWRLKSPAADTSSAPSD